MLCRQTARISERWLPLTSGSFLCNRGEIPEEGRVRRGGEDAQGREVARLQTSEDACISRRGPGCTKGVGPSIQSCAWPQNRQARVSHPPPPSSPLSLLALLEAGTGPAYRRGQRPCGGCRAFSQMSPGVGIGQTSGGSHFGKPCDFGQTLRPLTFRLLLYKIQKASLHPGNACPGA